MQSEKRFMSAPLGAAPYALSALAKGLSVLESLQSESVPQTQDQIRRRTGIAKATLYRILKTLVLQGYAIETPEHTFIKTAGSQDHRIRVGFGTSSHYGHAPQDLLANLRKHAGALGIDLLVLDNEDGKQVSVRNVHEFIRAQAEVVFESFVDPQYSAIIGEMLRTAGKPVIAIESPLPDATYFGMDHYRAGSEAGERLARFAKRRWRGAADFFVGVCSAVGSRSDQLNPGRLRIQGAFASVRSAIRLGMKRGCEIVAAAGAANIRDRVRVLFARHGLDARILILAADEGADAAVAKVVCEFQRYPSTAIAGFRSGAQIVRRKKVAPSATVASVYCDTRTYARELLEIGLALRAGKVIPPYNHAKHIVTDCVSLQELTLQPSSNAHRDLELASIHSS